MRRKAPQKLRVCGGFDGSTTSDLTGIRLETHAGHQITPRYGPSNRPTVWDPAEFKGSIPRGEVRAAMAELFSTYSIERMYCDPRDWWTEIDEWALEFGGEHVIVWDTGGGNTRIAVVHAMLERFVTDLTTGAITHDGCPVTALHMANARKVAKPGERYILGKPTDHQKIDMAMASCLAHEAACDARASGWLAEAPHRPTIVRR